MSFAFIDHSVVKNLKFLLLVPIFLASCLGCATLFSESSADVNVESEPENASVYIDGIEKGRETPTTITLEHSYSDVWNDKEVTVRLDGYEDRKFKIDHGIAGWYWGNILLGPFAGIGGIIDLVTGSWVSVDRTQYSVELREATSKVESKESVFYSDYEYLPMSELEKDKNGNYLIPQSESGVIVRDSVSDKLIIFHKK